MPRTISIGNQGKRMNACISRRVNISTEPEAVRSADDNQGQREKTS